MKGSLDLELSSLEANALFGALDTNGTLCLLSIMMHNYKLLGDGILSTRELMSYIFGVTARLRQEYRDAHAFSLPDSGYTFSRSVFNRTIMLILQGVNYTTQELPDGVLTLDKVQQCIKNRWNVSLTSHQVQCLCHKLVKTHRRCMLNRREFLYSYSSDVISCESDGETMTITSISGQVLNSFHYQLRLYMAG